MTTIAEYLAARLAHLGVHQIFGVPGDFSLALVAALSGPGHLEWVGTANELDAGYAADGYARRRGLGALVTTFGVGELSALNAVAGAYAEQVPVVAITGSPATGPAQAGALLHHTLGDGDTGHTVRAFREFTAAAEVLTAADAPDQIDHVLLTALTHLRPVYLGIPADLVTAPVPDAARRLSAPLRVPPSDDAALAAFTAAARALLTADAASPVLLVGHLVSRLAAGSRLRRLAGASGWPVAELLSGLGATGAGARGPVPVTGTYAAALGDPGVRAVVDGASPLITVGALMTDVVSGFFTHQPDPAREIVLGLGIATVAGQAFPGIRLPDALDALTRLVTSGAVPAHTPSPGTPSPAPESAAVPQPLTAPSSTAGSLTQAELWQVLSDWLPPHGTLVTDIGTSFWGIAGMTLPADTVLEAQPVWSSIGWALPATLGAALAEPARRAVLVTGDGAAQMTAAELGLLARRAPGTIVILVDNAGYTIERALRDPAAAYHDVTPWDWPALAAALAPGRPPFTVTVKTAGELAAALAQAGAETGRLSFVHVVTSQDDAPPLLRALARAATGSRP